MLAVSSQRLKGAVGTAHEPHLLRAVSSDVLRQMLEHVASRHAVGSTLLLGELVQAGGAASG